MLKSSFANFLRLPFSNYSIFYIKNDFSHCLRFKSSISYVFRIKFTPPKVKEMSWNSVLNKYTYKCYLYS